MPYRLAIGASNGPLEKEADHVADQVLAAPANVAVSAAAPHIQRFAGQAGEPVAAMPASVNRVLAGPGRPLESALRHDMEQRFGHDFSRVRVHSDATAEQSALDVNANAYTVSNDIVFGANRFAPESNEGRHLLAHELAHVVQQSGSTSSIARMQRQPRGSAAGCGICMNDPGGRAAGNISHAEVQSAFIAMNPDMVAERPVPGIPNSGIDLSYEKRRSGQHALFIGEIKPLDDAGRQADIGRTQLRDYAREMLLSGEYDEIFRMPDTSPPGPLYFHNPLNPPGCPQQTIMVQITEPGLYQYYCEPPFSQLVRNSSCRCRRPDDEQPPVPPIYVRPGDQPSDTQDKGKGKGDGEGKSDGELDKGKDQPDKGKDKPNRGNRKPGRDQPQQPTFMMPSWVPGAAILAILGAIVAWGSRTLPGKIAAMLGTLLGRLALALGLSLGFFGGTGTATAGGSKDGARGGPPKGNGSKVSGKDTVMVPRDPVIVPRPDKTQPLAGTVDVPARIPTSKTPLDKGGPAVKVPKKGQHIRLALIEGLNLGKLTTGKLTMVEIDPGGPNEKVVLMKAKSVNAKGSNVTAEFESILFECSQKGKNCDSGGNIYIVTHPYRGGDTNPLIAHSIKEFGNTQGMDQTLEAVEQLLRQ